MRTLNTLLTLALSLPILQGCMQTADDSDSISNTNKPNIIVIMADDIGVGDISFYNQQILNKQPVVNTPNIDSIAQQGIWFEDGHSATALCAPTRYAIMTGKNNYRSYAPWGVWGTFQPNAISDDEPTLANVVKPAGYKTAFVGKWHLGGDFALKGKDKIFRGRDEGHLPQVDLTTMVGGGPNDLGFDYSFMLPDGIQGPVYLAYEDQKWYPLNTESTLVHVTEQTALNPAIVSDKGDGMGDSHWRTAPMGHLLAQKAADFIKQQSVDTPFMMYYASPMAHLPHIPPESFDGIKVKGATPSAHLDMVFELDLQVGKIIDALKEKGVYQDTLIIFTSDNGGLAYRVPGTRESGHKVSGIYRGSKNAAHEGGHRVPYIVSWPAKALNPQQRSEPVLVQDILATIAEVAGNPLPVEQRPDSKSFLPILESKSYQARPFMMLQSGSTNDLIYREGDWKLIIKSDHKLTKMQPVALFNLADNVQELEKFNLIANPEHKQKVDGLLSRYQQIRASGVPTVQ